MATMILSRRSLLVSMGVHTSLVLGGYFVFLSMSEPVRVPESGAASPLQVTAREVRVAVPLRPPAPPTLPQSAELPSSEVNPAHSPEQSIEQPEPAPTEKSVTTPTIPKPKDSGLAAAYPKAKPVRPSPSSSKTQPGKPPAPKQPSPGTDWRPPAPPGPKNEEPGPPQPESTVTRRASLVSRPEYNLTTRFPDLSSIQVRAKFEIAEDGSYQADLLSFSGNPSADVMIMAKLLEYKWLPAMEKGVPVKDTRVLDISLEG